MTKNSLLKVVAELRHGRFAEPVKKPAPQFGIAVGLFRQLPMLRRLIAQKRRCSVDISEIPREKYRMYLERLEFADKHFMISVSCNQDHIVKLPEGGKLVCLKEQTIRPHPSRSLQSDHPAALPRANACSGTPRRSLSAYLQISAHCTTDACRRPLSPGNALENNELP